MSINFTVEKSIAMEMLRLLPVIASRDGQVVIRSNRGMLSVISNGKGTSYSYVPTNGSDIPISQHGLSGTDNNRIAELSYYLLDTHGGKIAHSSERAIDKGSNFGGNLTGFPYSDVNRRSLVLGNLSRMDKNVDAGGGLIGREGLGDMGGGRGTDLDEPLIPSPFTDLVPNGYGEFDTTGIRTTRINASEMFNQGRGYSLSGGSAGNLLTSGTYDGGNVILTGGSDAYRSNYGDNRLPGTEYGEILYGESETVDNDIQDVTDTVESWLDTDYTGVTPRTGFIDNDADVNIRMMNINNSNRRTLPSVRGAGVNMINQRRRDPDANIGNRMNSWNATTGSVDAMRGSNARRSNFISGSPGIEPVNRYMPIFTKISPSRTERAIDSVSDGFGILGNGSSDRLTDMGTYPNYLGIQNGYGDDTILSTRSGIGGVPDTYNNAASDIGVGYGDLTA